MTAGETPALLCQGRWHAKKIRNFESEGLLAMNRFKLRPMVLVAILCGLLLSVPVNAQEAAKFDSDTISGLGARNIGSGVISRRRSGLTGLEESGRINGYV